MKDKLDKTIKNIKDIELDKNVLKNDQRNIEWDALERMYGKSISQAIENPLQVHKKLIGTEKKLIKPKEPMLMMQKKDSASEWYEGVTQGVFDYKGSDGTTKRVWLNKKFLATMIWGNDSVRYYNCTEDSFIPNGTTNTNIEFEELEKIMNKQALNHEKLKAKEFSAKGEMFMDIAKGIGMIILSIGAVIVAGKMFGINILDYVFGTKDAIVETAKVVATNVTQVASGSAIP